MTPNGHGLILGYARDVRSDERIVLRCAKCPGWSKATTMGRCAEDFARHVAGGRHAGRMKRRPRSSRLLQASDGRWRL